MSWFLIKDFYFGHVDKHLDVIKRLKNGQEILVRYEDWRYEDGTIPQELTCLYPQENYIGVSSIESFRCLLFDRKLDGGIHKWYNVSKEKHLSEIVSYLTYYNIIITPEKSEVNQVTYYINFIENIRFCLAIYCPDDNIEKIKMLLPEYNIEKYFKGMEI